MITANGYTKTDHATTPEKDRIAVVRDMCLASLDSGPEGSDL